MVLGGCNIPGTAVGDIYPMVRCTPFYFGRNPGKAGVVGIRGYIRYLALYSRAPDYPSILSKIPYYVI